MTCKHTETTRQLLFIALNIIPFDVVANNATHVVPGIYLFLDLWLNVQFDENNWIQII